MSAFFDGTAASSQRPPGALPEEVKGDDADLAFREQHPFIAHDSALTLIAMTAVIYAYGKTPGFELRIDERLDAFMERIEGQGPVEEMLPTKPFRIEMLKLLRDRVPDAVVVDFISLNDDGDLQVGVFCSVEKRSIVVSFRGSESTADWVQNAMAWRTSLGGNVDPDIKVHYGFADQLAPGYDRIVAVLRKHQEAHPDFSIHVTGHSLGGAIATLFGFRAARDLPQLNMHVVTFAAPRVGNQPFVDAYHALRNLALTRITNAGDAFTTIPMLGYTHSGNVVRFYDDHVELFAVDRKYYNTWWEFSLFKNLQVAPHALAEHYENLKRLPW